MALLLGSTQNHNYTVFIFGLLGYGSNGSNYYYIDIYYPQKQFKIILIKCQVVTIAALLAARFQIGYNLVENTH